MSLDIKEKLKDLIQQATKEKSHYYVKSVAEEALLKINHLESSNEWLLGVLSNYEKIHNLLKKDPES